MLRSNGSPQTWLALVNPLIYQAKIENFQRFLCRIIVHLVILSTWLHLSIAYTGLTPLKRTWTLRTFARSCFENAQQVNHTR
jgi:hypothetical protein